MGHLKLVIEAFIPQKMKNVFDIQIRLADIDEVIERLKGVEI